MRTYFVLSAVAADRTGLVDDLSRFLFERGCNLEDSRMAVLGGEFAIALLASGDGPALARVRADLPGLEREAGLSALVRETAAPTTRSRAPAVPYALTAFSMDHPGIVHEVTRLLREHRVNIEELETRSTPAPDTGTPLFTLKLTMTVPADVPVRRLREALDELADRQNLDVVLQPAGGGR